MVERFSCRITDALVNRNYIINEQRAIYEFHTLMFLEKMITIVSILTFSLIMNVFLQTLVFGVSFLSLRKRTGGFHANTFLKCYMLSLITYIASIKILHPLLERATVTVILTMLFCAGAIIFFIGTVNHPNLGLEESELNISKRLARKIVLVIMGISAACMMFLETKIYGISVCIALAFCAFGLILSKLVKQEI